MTDKHDKLVEMALASGAQYHVTTDPGVWLELDAEALAAFAAAHVASLCAAINALESALRLVLAQRVPPGCVVVPVERLTVEEIKTLRQQVRNDPRCQDEHWFVLMARAIEDRYLAAALTDQSQKKESP